jgi:hypothetical protein
VSSLWGGLSVHIGRRAGSSAGGSVPEVRGVGGSSALRCHAYFARWCARLAGFFVPGFRHGAFGIRGLPRRAACVAAPQRQQLGFWEVELRMAAI